MESIFQQLKVALDSGSVVSFFLALGLAYFGGILSSFTPCIYPMIPITIGFVGGASKKNLRSGWALSSIYVLGMAAVYSILGIVASLTGRIFGSLTNSSGWYLSLGVIMLISALWMFEVFKFDPNSLWSRTFSFSSSKKNSHHVKKHEPTYVGAFFLGISSGFIASPCTTPVLTTILSFVASTGSVLQGFLLMFFFSLGLGTLLVVLGTFAGALKVLPKSGHWLNTVKFVSGLVILAMAEYFIFKAGAIKGN